MNLKAALLYFFSILICFAFYKTYSRFERFKKKIEKLNRTLDFAFHQIPDNEVRTLPLHNEIRIQPGTVIPLHEIKTILAIKLDHIGDVLLTTPALKALREHFPSARIIALVSNWSKDILKNNPHVDELLFFDYFSIVGRSHHLSDKKKSQLADLLSPYSFDLCIDFRKEPETRETMVLSKPRYMVGYGGHSLPFTLTIELPSIRRRDHRVEQFLDLVRVLGAQPTHSEPTLYLSEEDRSFAESFLAGHDIHPGDTLIGIHPGARDEVKRWFPERYSALMDKLAIEFPDAKIIIFSGPLEKTLISEILSKTNAKPIVCNNSIQLLQFAAVLEKMHVFIGNNSAPVHIAAAMNTPVVEIHSAFVDSREWSPYGKRNFVLESNLPCAPCHKTICRTMYYEEGKPVPLFCLRLIQPDDVMNAVKKVLDGRYLS